MRETDGQELGTALLSPERRLKPEIPTLKHSSTLLQSKQSQSGTKRFFRDDRSSSCSHPSFPGIYCTLHLCRDFLSGRKFILPSLADICVINKGVAHKSDNAARDRGLERHSVPFTA
jgi:hypothetical protein